MRPLAKSLDFCLLGWKYIEKSGSFLDKISEPTVNCPDVLAVDIIGSIRIGYRSLWKTLILCPSQDIGSMSHLSISITGTAFKNHMLNKHQTQILKPCNYSNELISVFGCGRSLLSLCVWQMVSISMCKILVQTDK